MSYTTVLAIYPNEKIEELFELRNAWGSAPVIWDAMAQNYLGLSSFMMATLKDQGKALWALCTDGNIPFHHRIVHAMTMDHAYIEKKDYKRAASDIRKFLADFKIDLQRVNHWYEIADFLDSEPEQSAIGFHMTSVSENPFLGSWNEDKGEYNPIDWDKCYSVYEVQ
ncbi:hypothetical protein [Acinetobacter sp. Marseille-P8610]|uniref:hypothetical protein n=1 Tax=Acinetobacter sp. Marseille-P8610 TaxID=2864459 RepID=UPI001CE408AB|nr:hypothetical protein [Acinetobacter sp. Marseille-P8610]